MRHPVEVTEGGGGTTRIEYDHLLLCSSDGQTKDSFELGPVQPGLKSMF